MGRSVLFSFYAAATTTKTQANINKERKQTTIEQTIAKNTTPPKALQSPAVMPPWQDDKFGSLTSLMLSYWSPKRSVEKVSVSSLWPSFNANELKASMSFNGLSMKSPKHCTSGHNSSMHNFSHHPAEDQSERWGVCGNSSQQQQRETNRLTLLKNNGKTLTSCVDTILPLIVRLSFYHMLWLPTKVFSHQNSCLKPCWTMTVSFKQLKLHHGWSSYKRRIHNSSLLRWNNVVIFFN